MKQPSAELASMIKTAAENLISFGELWTSIKKKGADEGFTEKELQDILRPLIKPKLNKDQVYYLFHSEEKKEASKKQYHRNIPTNDDKKPLEQTYTPSSEPAKTIEKVKEVYEDIEEEPQEPNQVPDAVFTAKKLAKALDEINVLNVKLEQERKTVAQLQDVEKKRAFTTAADTMDEFHYDKIAIPMLMTELRKRQSSGWHFVRVKVEYVS